MSIEKNSFTDDFVRNSDLLSRAVIGELSDKEQQEFEHWLEAEENRKLYEKVCDRANLKKEWESFRNLDTDAMYADLKSRYPHINRHKTRHRLLVRIASTAALVAIVVTGYFLLENRFTVRSATDAMVVENQTGGTVPVLILADGRSVELQKTSSDSILSQQGTQIVNADGELTYTSGGDAKSLEYNTLKVPRGYRYHLTLDDGTRVQMNADSELRFPVNFTGKERRVYLSGEAFFEVKKDNRRAFFVETSQAEVKVYGTSFNVNTHASDVVEAVLVSGNVSLRALSSEVETKMSPSQLAILDLKTNNIELKRVNTQIYTSWCSGSFVFEDQPLKLVLERLERWYDFKTEYSEADLGNVRIFGTMTQFDDFEIILRAIEKTTDIKFQINGKKVKVLR